jgi:tetratricopeptide (TPR) repeat protein
MGGVGKTQLAAEYAYRFAADYDIVWWINAESQAAAREGLANLAVRLDLGGPAAETSELIRAALDALRTGHPYRRWLLVFDNAGAPADIQPLLPSGQGHVLITSRDQTWENQADVLDVDVYARAESIDFLRRRVRGLTTEVAGQLAEELGDLPLALEHAAGFLAAGQMTAGDYLAELRKQASELLNTRPPANYPVSVAVTWTISANKLRDQDDNAARLLDMCAFIGPEPIPLSLLAKAPPGTLPAGLGMALESAGHRAAILESIRAYSLARIGGTDEGPFPGPSLQQHRLVQAVVRDTVSAAERAEYRATAHRILAAADPGDPELPANWPVYAELLPHVLSSGAVANTDPPVRRLVLHEARTLWRRAEFRTCLDLVEEGTAVWSRELDEVDPDILLATHERSNALQGLGRYSDTRRANQEWYDLTMRRLGPDHPETLLAAGWVAKDHRTLGNFAPALKLNQHILDVRIRDGRDTDEALRAAHNLAVNYRMTGDFATALEIDRYNAEARARTQGPDTFSALFAVNNVARDLRELGNYYESLEMQENTFSRYRELFGVDSPETLRAMKNLAVSRRKAGRYAEAAELAEEVLERHRRKMGDLHPETFAAATNFANDHRCLGQYATGQGLAELAVRGYQRLFGDDNAFTACTAVNLAALLRLTGDPERARAVNKDALPKLRGSFGPGHRYTLSCAVNLASDLAELGEPENARDIGSATLTALRDGCGEDHPYTLSCAVNLALDLRALGERDSYRDLLTDTIVRYNNTLGSGHPESVSATARERAVCDIEPPPV